MLCSPSKILDVKGNRNGTWPRLQIGWSQFTFTHAYIIKCFIFYKYSILISAWVGCWILVSYSEIFLFTTPTFFFTIINDDTFYKNILNTQTKQTNNICINNYLCCYLLRCSVNYIIFNIITKLLINPISLYLSMSSSHAWPLEC